MVETGFSVVERSGDLTGKGCVLYSRRLDYQSMMGELGVDLCMENWVPVRIIVVLQMQWHRRAVGVVECEHTLCSITVSYEYVHLPIISPVNLNGFSDSDISTIHR
jgi:hypothetical protein